MPALANLRSLAQHQHFDHGGRSAIVNARRREVVGKTVSYEEIVKLAFPDEPSNQDIDFTVAYANPHGKDGTLGCCQLHGHGSKLLVLHGAAIRVIVVATSGYAQRPPWPTSARWPVN